MPESPAFPGFGEIDLDLPKSSEGEPCTGDEPHSSTFERRSDPDLPSNAHTKVTLRKSEDEDDPHSRPTPPPPALDHDDRQATRIVLGESLTNLTRAKLAKIPNTHDKTRMGSVDDLLALTRDEADPPPSVPSGSGVATREGRVAAMRELYAKGDAEGALQLASTLTNSEPPPSIGGIDRGWDAGGTEDPANAVDIEIGEEVEIDIEVEGDARPQPSQAPAPVLLTLTDRQGIPRVLRTPGEIATLPIDHRAGFLLAHIDGMQTMEEILDVCAMPPQEALQMIKELEKLGVIVIE